MVGLVGQAVAPQTVVAAAGINQKINFQGRLLNAAGAIVADGNYNVEFKIYQDGAGTAAGDPGGTLKWTEDYMNSNSTPNPVVVKNGYFSVTLGTYCPLSGAACTGGQSQSNSAVDFNQDTLWLSMNVAGSPHQTDSCAAAFATNCSPDGEMVPMRRMTAAPYALHAQSCVTCILQAPSSTVQNTITPTVNSVVGLTVNGTSGTANTAVQVNQAGAADAVDVAVSTSGTSTNGLSVAMSGSGTLTNGIQVSRSAGTLSTGLLFSGAIGTEIKLQNSESIANSTNGTITMSSDSGALTLNLNDQSTSATITNNTGNLILDSASNTLGIAASDTTLQRSAAGTFAIDLLDAGANTTLNVTNSDGTRVANLSVEGQVTVGSFAAATSTAVCS
ncbi:MAG TPA: hypothetical protein VLF67_01400, partial [Candidatus Saccharimonas sp.]|nr:hypothetical protein [Candidatus Saccharimonas sp.]